MKPNIIKIDKNIPIPAIRWGAGRPSVMEFMKTMDIGDSFVINGQTPDIKPATAMGSAYGMASKLRKKGGETSNFKVTCRVIDGGHKDPKAVRIWRAQ